MESVLSMEKEKEKEMEVEEAECVTPRDSGCRIPEPVVCPPAPRKKRAYLKPKQLPSGYYKDVVTNSEVDRVLGLMWEQLEHCS